MSLIASRDIHSFIHLLCVHQIHTKLGTNWIWNLSFDNVRGFIDLMAKQALLSPGVISSTCYFHDKFESVALPRNLIVWATVICVHKRFLNHNFN
jgi:hypothetical protein